MQRLGFFGGCFNPPTIAHLEIALKAIEIEKLDKVYFVPMGDYYKKEGLLPAEERYNMLKIMVEEYPKLDVSRIQMDQRKELHAIDTFKLIDKEFNESENFFIMGSDNFEKIEHWKSANELLSSYKYIIFNRDNFVSTFPIVVDDGEPYKKISSSSVRSRSSKGESIDNLVTKKVKNYILKNKLYM